MRSPNTQSPKHLWFCDQNIYVVVTTDLEQASRCQIPGTASLTWNKQQIQPSKSTSHYFKKNVVHLQQQYLC